MSRPFWRQTESGLLVPNTNETREFDTEEETFKEWYGQCRTCLHWGEDEDELGKNRRHAVDSSGCTNPESDLYEEQTFTSGSCLKWASYSDELSRKLNEEEQRSKG